MLFNTRSAAILRVASALSVSNCKTGTVRMSFEVIDQQNTRARVVLYWSKKVCEDYEKKILINTVWKMARFNMRPVPKQYRISDFSHELILNDYSTLEDASEQDAHAIPSIKFTYIPVGSIADHSVGSIISMLATLVLHINFIFKWIFLHPWKVAWSTL